MVLTYHNSLSFILLGLGLSKIVTAESPCSPSTFNNVTFLGGKILNIDTRAHSNLSMEIPPWQNNYAKTVTDASACEVTVSYTHPGQGETINTVVWLPPSSKWTGRFMGAGGGAMVTGAESNMTFVWAVDEGFAVVSTDGGHTAEDSLDFEKWGMLGPGKVNLPLLEDFASTALDDAAVLGKAVVRAYYGKAPDYSYWNGCSQGGRQGFMMAQKYPTQYDGILATAPAIAWNELMMQLFWPQAVMNDLDTYPSNCEFEAINTETIKACDALDGLEDGIISLPQQCKFDPDMMVGKQYPCSATNISTTISEAAAFVTKKAWQGATKANGDFLWYGTDPGASLAMTAETACTGDSCSGRPFLLAELWIKYFVKADPKFQSTAVNNSNFEAILEQSKQQYEAIIGTSDANLKPFGDAGGKLLTWHGLSDGCIAPGATADYARRVHEFDSTASNYFRYFEAPGVDHCGGGRGWYPGSGFKSLIDWVEKGVAPDTLSAQVQGEGVGGKANLCLWPKKLVYDKGDPKEASSFTCVS